MFRQSSSPLSSHLVKKYYSMQKIKQVNCTYVYDVSKVKKLLLFYITLVRNVWLKFTLF